MAESQDAGLEVKDMLYLPEEEDFEYVDGRAVARVSRPSVDKQERGDGTMKNIWIDQSDAVLTIRIDLTKRSTPSKDGRLILATTGSPIKLSGGLQLSVCCLQDEKRSYGYNDSKT